MTWSSSRAELVALLLPLLAACAGEEVFETQVFVLAETEACASAAERGQRVNGYSVLLFELLELPEDDSRLPCVTCPFVEVACRCGRPIVPLTIFFNQQLSGVRFSTLSPGSRYCVGVAAFDIPDLPAPPDGERSAVDCPCDFGGADLGETSRVCGISVLPAQVGENAAFVPVSAECRPMGCPTIERARM